MLGHAIELSKLTGRKILIYPPSARIWDNEFSLSWLQLIDFNAINQILHPLRRPCLIRGLNYGTREAAILEYVVNGTLANRRPECAESPDDAPWQLRDPQRWSTDCYLLPWTFTAPIADAANASSIPVVVTNLDRSDHHFPGADACAKGVLAHDRHLVEAGRDPVPTLVTLQDELVLTTGDVMYHCDSLPAADLPASPQIESIAEAIVLAHARPVLCMHVRRGDLNLVPLQAFVETANDLRNRSAVHDVIVITDAADVEIVQLRSGIDSAITIGCDGDRFQACRNSADMKAAVEQQVCASADVFVGSPESTFTGRVMHLRRQRGQSDHSSFVLK